MSLVPEEIVKWCVSRKPYGANIFREALEESCHDIGDSITVICDVFQNLDSISFYFMEYCGRFAADDDKEKGLASISELCDLATHLEECLDGAVKLLPLVTENLIGDTDSEKTDGDNDDMPGRKLKMSEVRDNIPFQKLYESLMEPVKNRIENWVDTLDEEEKALLSYHLADALPSLAIVRFCLGFIPAPERNVPVSVPTLYDTMSYEVGPALLRTRIKGEPFDNKGLVMLLEKALEGKK